MSTQENAQIVKVFFAARGRGDRQGLLALSAPDRARRASEHIPTAAILNRFEPTELDILKRLCV